MEAINPQPSHNTKKAVKIAKKRCKRIQTKEGEVLTHPEVLEDYKKKSRHSKQPKKLSKECHKDLVDVMKVKEHEEQEGMDINEKENDMYVIDYVCPKCVPANADLDHVFNCFKCSP